MRLCVASSTRPHSTIFSSRSTLVREVVISTSVFFLVKVEIAGPYLDFALVLLVEFGFRPFHCSIDPIVGDIDVDTCVTHGLRNEM